MNRGNPYPDTEKEEPKRSFKHYIIPIVLSILILGIIGVYAGLTSICMSIILCPITKRRYERFDNSKYHIDDCPYCKVKKKTKVNYY